MRAESCISLIDFVCKFSTSKLDREMSTCDRFLHRMMKRDENEFDSRLLISKSSALEAIIAFAFSGDIVHKYVYPNPKFNEIVLLPLFLNKSTVSLRNTRALVDFSNAATMSNPKSHHFCGTGGAGLQPCFLQNFARLRKEIAFKTK